MHALLLLSAMVALTLTPPAAADPGFAALLDDPQFDAHFLGTLRVSRGGTVLLEMSRGVDRAGRPAARDTAYWVGSISKHFATAALLSVMDEAGHPLDAPVASLIAEWPAHALRKNGVDCSVRLLLGHQCGLPRDSNRDATDTHRDAASEREFLDRLAGAELAFEPGTAFAYSNTGYELAGVLASRIAGMPYHELLQRRLFGPLGLVSTGSASARVPALADRIAPGHFELPWLHFSSERWLGIPWDAPSRVGAAGDSFSTAPELERWLRALLRGTVLPPSLVQAMLTPGRERYGLGLVIDDHPAGQMVWHNGALSPHGHNAFVGHLVQTDTTVVVLANRGREFVSATAIGRGLMDLAHDRQPSKPVMDVTLSRRLSAGTIGSLWLSMILLAPLWCIALAFRTPRKGMLPWMLSVASAAWITIAAHVVLDGFRPALAPTVAPFALAIQAAVLWVGIRRWRHLPLVVPERKRRTILSAAASILLFLALSIAFEAVLPTFGVLSLTAAAIALAAHLRRTSEALLTSRERALGDVKIG